MHILSTIEVVVSALTTPQRSRRSRFGEGGSPALAIHDQMMQQQADNLVGLSN